MNAALEMHRDSLLFQAMLKACDAELEGEDLGVAVYDEDADQPSDHFTIRMQEGSFAFVSHSQSSDGDDWEVSEDYLDQVIADPKRYIENPSLLSFDWLKQRLGLVA